MTVAALYDIHGNLPALEAVLEDVARQDLEGDHAGDCRHQAGRDELDQAPDGRRHRSAWICRIFSGPMPLPYCSYTAWTAFW